MAARPYPDDREERGIQLSFVQFISRSQVLYANMQQNDLTAREEADAAKAFFKFVLAGRTSVDNRARHITVNACQDVPEPVAYHITRDYDSLIGMSNDLPYSVHLALTPVPPFRDTLTQPNHIKGRAYIGGVARLAALHTIPNFAFAKVATRSIVRVFLPRMYGRESKLVPSQDLAVIYDSCLRPLVVDMLSNMATHWPATYRSAVLLYKDRHGGIHPGSLDVPAHRLEEFGQRYLEVLGQIKPEFRDAYFVHELRGWKGATVHDPDNVPDKVGALDELTRILDMGRVVQEDWQVDVALELGLPGHVVSWKTSGHKALLRYCLPSLGGEVHDLMNRSSFLLDETMHLKDISGFRCSPGVKGKRDHVTYIQAYLTEKTMSYQQHKGLFNNINAKALLTTPSLSQLTKNMETMSDIMGQCMDEEGARDGEPRAQEGCARIEIRVRLCDALNVLEDFPMHTLRRCLLAIPSQHWWYFKWYRLAAMFAVMKNLSESSPRNRRSECALVLGAIIIWLLNGLFHCPQPQFLELARSACQEVPRNYSTYNENISEPEDRTPLMYDAGLYFVCDIVVDQSGTYRLPYHKSFSEDAIIAAFKIPLSQLREAMGGTGLSQRKARSNPERSNNRTQNKTLRVDDIRGDDRPLPQIDGDRLNNIRVRAVQRMRGEDVEHFMEFGGGNRHEVIADRQQHDAEDLSVRVQKLLEQFFFDILQQAPNHKAAHEGSWTNIPKELRSDEATEMLYQTLDLPFTAAQYTFCSDKVWMTHFNRMFPAQRPATIGQNFKQSTYYAQWLTLLDLLDAQSLSRVRSIIKAKFDTLLWIPYTQSDRMWTTRSNPGMDWVTLPEGEVRLGPQIALNPRARHPRYGRPSLRRAPEVREREEDIPEEEEEEEEPIREQPDQRGAAANNGENVPGEDA